MMMFGLEQMEVKFHEKLNETVGRVNEVCESRVVSSFGIHRIHAAVNGTKLSDDRTMLEDRVRSETVDNFQSELDRLKPGSVAKKMRS